MPKTTLGPQAVYQQFAEAQAALEAASRQCAIAELLSQRAEIHRHLEALG